MLAVVTYGKDVAGRVTGDCVSEVILFLRDRDNSKTWDPRSFNRRGQATPLPGHGAHEENDYLQLRLLAAKRLLSMTRAKGARDALRG